MQFSFSTECGTWCFLFRVKIYISWAGVAISAMDTMTGNEALETRVEIQVSRRGCFFVIVRSVVFFNPLQIVGILYIAPRLTYYLPPTCILNSIIERLVVKQYFSKIGVGLQAGIRLSERGRIRGRPLKHDPREKVRNLHDLGIPLITKYVTGKKFFGFAFNYDSQINGCHVFFRELLIYLWINPFDRNSEVSVLYEKLENICGMMDSTHLWWLGQWS